MTYKKNICKRYRFLDKSQLLAKSDQLKAQNPETITGDAAFPRGA